MSQIFKIISLFSSGIIIGKILDKYFFNVPFKNLFTKYPKNLLSIIKSKYKHNRNSPFIVIVGLGGVGSHVTMTLLRNGITKLRIIDFDKVTISSLNRHSFSLFKDIGKLKTEIIINYAKKLYPFLTYDIETKSEIYNISKSEEFIKKGDPDYVIDCIDDLDAKIDLINFCINNNIKIISSMGAAGKKDPSKIRFSSFEKIKGDIMAKRIRYYYKKKYNSLPVIPSIFSIEKNVRELHLDENNNFIKKKNDIDETEGTRALPVFACLPGSFGKCVGYKVLFDLFNIKIEDYCSYNIMNDNLSDKDKKKEVIMVGSISLNKLIDDFINFEKNKRNTNEKDLILVYDDFYKIAKAFDFKSSFSCKVGAKMKFIRWRIYKPISKNNIVLLTKSEIELIFHVKNEDELINSFGKENVERIDKILNSI